MNMEASPAIQEYDPIDWFASHAQINGTRIVPVDTIRFIKPMTDEDRNRAGGKLEIDASKFNVRIEFADKSTKLAVETIEQIERQGVGLVNREYRR
jgi:hypothetical protein